MQTVKVKDVEIGSGRLAVLAGPCVAESKELCLEIAGRMKEICRKLDLGYIFKASFDKANRSSIDSYRGPGLERGLEILEAVKQEFDLPVVTDIHENNIAFLCIILAAVDFLHRRAAQNVFDFKKIVLVYVDKPVYIVPYANALVRVDDVARPDIHPFVHKSIRLLLRFAFYGSGVFFYKRTYFLRTQKIMPRHYF